MNVLYNFFFLTCAYFFSNVETGGGGFWATHGKICSDTIIYFLDKVGQFPVSYFLWSVLVPGPFQAPVRVCVHAQSCLTLCSPVNCNPPVSSVHEILQARVPVPVAISSSRGSSRSRDWTCISCVSCIGRWILSHYTTQEAHLLLGIDSNCSVYLCTSMWFQTQNSFYFNHICFLFPLS